MPKYHKVKKLVGYVTRDLDRYQYADYLKDYPEGTPEEFLKLTGRKVKKADIPKPVKEEPVKAESPESTEK